MPRCQKTRPWNLGALAPFPNTIGILAISKLLLLLEVAKVPAFWTTRAPDYPSSDCLIPRLTVQKATPSSARKAA